MLLGRYVLLALLLLPAAEIAAFIAMASAIGFLQALALFLATSLIGLLILRGNGVTWIVTIPRPARHGTSAVEAQAAGMVVMVGGALLVLPGFLSDLFGLLLLLAPRTVSRALLRRLFGAEHGDGAPPGVVDLDRDEWRQEPERPIEDRRGRNGSA
ncbi:MAG: hypothetical protein GEU91_20650 [Rhizobiales bacterium]|nr:hypothetical protein [Hyphomicrobiales bacterium]